MSSQFKEMLSAVMDGEASEFEMRRLFDEAQRSPELRGVWSRYHLIGAVLRREGRSANPQAALDRLWARVDAGADTGERRAVRSRRLRYAALATSAAVAIVVLGVAVDVGLRRGARLDVLPGGNGVVASAPSANSESIRTDSVRMDPVRVLDESPSAVLVRDVPSESDVARARAYMFHHARHLALNPRVTGGVQYVKVAAFESR